MLFYYMDYYDIVGFLGIILGFIGIFAVGRKQKLVFFIISSAIVLIYTLIKPSYPFIFLFLVLEAYFIYEAVKIRKKKSLIKLIEVESNNTYIQEFIDNYKKDIFNFFPFYNYSPIQKRYLIFRDMDLIGLLIGELKGDDFYIEIDYLKPSHRDLEVGNYIYKINPGYFIKIGAKRLLTKCYHKGHCKYLRKMGFNEITIDGQLFYEKKID